LRKSWVRIISVFFIRKVVTELDLSGFERSYSAEGGPLYAPELMLGVWLYAYAIGITSARLLSRRLGEDLPLRYLAGGARVDNWALSAFRRRHAVGLNDTFTQVLEMARGLGLGKLGRVAIDANPGQGQRQPRSCGYGATVAQRTSEAAPQRAPLAAGL